MVALITKDVNKRLLDRGHELAVRGGIAAVKLLARLLGQCICLGGKHPGKTEMDVSEATKSVEFTFHMDDGLDGDTLRLFTKELQNYTTPMDGEPGTSIHIAPCSDHFRKETSRYKQPNGKRSKSTTGRGCMRVELEIWYSENDWKKPEMVSLSASSILYKSRL